jgi:hypothetical protein
VRGDPNNGVAPLVFVGTERRHAGLKIFVRKTKNKILNASITDLKFIQKGENHEDKKI